MKVITTIGATLTGNKGAASMLIALVQNLKKVIVDDFIINSLTIYAKEDKKFNFYKNLYIVRCTPFDIICIAMPLAFFYYFVGWINPLRKFLLQNRILKTVYDADLIVNIAGISYSDGRGLVLLYNIACDVIPIMLRKKVFKYSQAIGPFKTFFNRVSAKRILPKMTKIAARGEFTIKNLEEFNLDNYEYCPDAAFSMSIDFKNLSKEMVELCNRLMSFQKMNIGITPSSVVEQYCKKFNMPYVDIMASFIESMFEDNKYKLILFPYCCLSAKRTKKNNDLWTARNIFKKINNKKNIIYLDKEYSAEDLKYLISCCKVLITSRYHGMITAISSEVIPLVIGWSHKYVETLKEFSLSDLCIDYSSLSTDLLKNKFLDIVNNRMKYKNIIISRLPKQKDASFKNFVLIKEMLESLK
jgi:polysaccharide pyruvyl transferase WcaK-like protein